MGRVLKSSSKGKTKIMISTNTVLRRHLSNVIYIENHFGLDLFKPSSTSGEEPEVDFEDMIMVRRDPASVAESEVTPDLSDESRVIAVEDFFRETQNYATDLNILPYFYEPEKFWANKEEFKCKLAHFPLVIIDWRLETGEDAKTGIDVFDEIIKDNDILHYYVIYSNELSGAIAAFKCKHPEAQVGNISENEVAVVNGNAIVMFANKRTSNIGFIIEKLASFTEDNYGYLPQLFLSVKQQIENRTATLYNDFMGLDSMLLPQLIVDEVYNYEGMQEEVILSLIVNKLRDDLRIEKQEDCYGKLVLIKLLNVEFLEDAFEYAKTVVKKAPQITLEEFKSRIKKIIELDCIKSFDFDSLKNAAQIFLTGSMDESFDQKLSEDKKNSKRRTNIKNFVLFLSICSDKDYYSKYVKLLSLIKCTEYTTDLCWSIQECEEKAKATALCQGDVFIDENSDSFLLCITPSCQLIRPEKIKYTYTFLRGTFSKSEIQKNQKQSFSMHLMNKEKNKVILVNWDFFAPVVVDFSNKESFNEFLSHKRIYRLNMEYVHKVVELYSEYIKQIGVEELFGKCIDEKQFFVELKDDDNVCS